MLFTLVLKHGTVLNNEQQELLRVAEANATYTANDPKKEQEAVLEMSKGESMNLFITKKLADKLKLSPPEGAVLVS